MPDQQSLLDWSPQTHKLYKKPGTSSRAAAGAAKFAGETFQKILAALANRPMTPDEVADATGITLLTVRPRMSQLAKPTDGDGNRIAPFITRTGEERLTASGKAADVMRITTDTERQSWRA